MANGFDVDDPDLCKLDLSSTTTLKRVTQSIRQYFVLTKNRFELLAAVEILEESKPSHEQEEATVVFPPVHSITAGQINDSSFTAKHQRRRQKRLAADASEADATRSALVDLSQNFINNVMTIKEVEAAQEELRTTRVHATLAARQRHKVKDIVLAESRDATALDHHIEASVKSNNVKPDLFKAVVFEDIPDVAAKSEDANPRSAGVLGINPSMPTPRRSGMLRTNPKLLKILPAKKG
ncbi:hypothetical protein BGZ47_000701 [Haplosporangium gracile]|nr:hypothetical protein BGZ47_000701 [Haplosporangium gracile]